MWRAAGGGALGLNLFLPVNGSMKYPKEDRAGRAVD
jgi:hypothetical protein